MQFTRVLCLFSLLCCGCVRTAVVKFWEPAEIDVSRMNRIVVLEFSGEAGKSVATSLSGQLWQNEFYTVVDRTELTHELQLANYEKDQPVALHEILPQARKSGIDGVVLGEVLEYRCDDHRVRRPRLHSFKDDELIEISSEPHRRGLGVEIRETTIREGLVSIAFRLIDVETGEVRASRQVSHQYTAEVDNGNEETLPADKVLEKLTQQCLTEIVSMLAPHEATSQIQLANCDIWTRGRREVKEGLQFAEQNRWKEAEKSWQKALEINPENHAALFNLSVVADHRHRYAQAEEYAMQAIQLQYRQCYAQGLDTIRTHRAAADKSEEQRDARVVLATEEIWR